MAIAYLHSRTTAESTVNVDALARELRGADRELALVFVRTKRGADRVVRRLRAAGIDAVVMHGNRSQAQREKALARFESGEIDTLVATDVAARGLDVEGVTHVINFDAPGDRADYVHRVGRTGRAGRAGVGITFVTSDQAHEVGRIATDLSLHAEFARSGLRATPRHPQPRSHRATEPAGRSTRSGRRR
jgi:superfamily II DNA/RNA helicase